MMNDKKLIMYQNLKDNIFNSKCSFEGYFTIYKDNFNDDDIKNIKLMIDSLDRTMLACDCIILTNK